MENSIQAFFFTKLDVVYLVIYYSSHLKVKMANDQETF